MKLAKLVLASSLAATCALADGVFLGVVGGYDFMTKIEVDETNFSVKDKNLFFGIKGGYDFGAWRAYGQYNYNLKASEDYTDDEGYPSTMKLKGHEFLVGADWTPSISENFKLAIGPYLGYANFKLKDFARDDSSEAMSENLDGFIFGGKVGIIADTSIGEFEAGIKADKAWLKGEEYDDYIVYDEDRITVGLYLGYNFKF